MAAIRRKSVASAPVKNVRVQAIDGKIIVESTSMPNGNEVLVFHDGKQTYEITAPAWWVDKVVEELGTPVVEDGETFAEFDFVGKAVRGQWDERKHWSGAVKVGKVYVAVK